MYGSNVYFRSFLEAVIIITKSGADPDPLPIVKTAICF